MAIVTDTHQRHPRPSAWKFAARRLAPATPGWMVTGDIRAVLTHGRLDTGPGLPDQRPFGNAVVGRTTADATAITKVGGDKPTKARAAYSEVVGAPARPSRASLAVVIAWPRCLCVCSATWTSSPSTFEGRRFFPMKRGS
jgi:hypothetical protein